MSYPAERRAHANLAGLLGLALLISACLFACHTEPAPGKTYMDVEVDASWLTGDTVRVVLMDMQGNPLDTLYQDKPASAADLKHLLAEGYQGGTVRIGIYLVKDGKVIRWETRDYNGQIGAVIGRDSLPLVKPPDTTKPIDTTKRALDLKPDAVTLYLGGEKRTLTAHPETTWAGKTLSWSTTPQGIVSVTPAGELSAAAAGDAEVVGEGQGGAKDTVKVKVVRDVPELDVGAPDTAILTKTTLAFKVRATQAYGVIAAFAWDLDGDGSYEDSATGFPAGQVEFATTPRTYDNEADIRLHFRVRDGEGNVDTASKRLQVTGTIPVITGLAARTVITIKDTVRFSAQASVSARTLAAYAWDYDGDGKTDDSAALAKAGETIAGIRRYDDSGTFKARLKVYDAAGTVQTANSEVRVERDPPRADAGANQTVETGVKVALKGTAFDSLGRIVSREWKIGAAAFAPGADTASFTAPAAAGTVPCLFKVTDDDGLSDTDTVIVTVVLKSAPALTWRARDTVVSIKDPVAFRVTVDARGAALKSFAWDWNNDGTADSSGTLSGRSAVLTATRSWAVAGTPTVGLTVTDQDNLSVSGSEKVTVKTYAPVVSAGADTAVTVSTRINLHGTDHDTVGSIVRREWKIGATGLFVIASKGDTSFTAPASAGPLVCTYKVTDDDGNVITDEVTVTVALSSNADLSALVVAPLTGAALALDSAFLPSRTVYQVAPVANTVAAVKVTPTASNAGATVTVNGSLVAAGESANVPILVGANPVEIGVTAPNGTTKRTYQVTAYRAAVTEAHLSFAVISTLADTGADLWSKWYNPWHTMAPPVKQLGRGRYTIDFYGLGGPDGRGANVQVNAFANNDSAYCRTESALKGSGTFVTVRCHGPNGQPKNAWPQILVQYPRAHETGANALVRVDQPTKTGTYLANPELSFNSAAKPIQITRTGVGAYTLLFKNLVASPTQLGSMAVTPYGTGTERCNIVTYAAAGTDLQATVRCFTTAGAAADAAFDAAVTFPLATASITGKTAGLLQGYGLYDIAATTSGVPNSPLMYNPKGVHNLTYSSVGNYFVDFNDMEGSSSPMQPVAIATAYGLTTGGYCQVNNTTVYIQTAAAEVSCHGPDGKPINAKFMLWFMR